MRPHRPRTKTGIVTVILFGFGGFGTLVAPTASASTWYVAPATSPSMPVFSAPPDPSDPVGTVEQIVRDVEKTILYDGPNPYQVVGTATECAYAASGGTGQAYCHHADTSTFNSGAQDMMVDRYGWCDINWVATLPGYYDVQWEYGVWWDDGGVAMWVPCTVDCPVVDHGIRFLPLGGNIHDSLDPAHEGLLYGYAWIIPDMVTYPADSGYAIHVFARASVYLVNPVNGDQTIQASSQNRDDFHPAKCNNINNPACTSNG